MSRASFNPAPTRSAAFAWSAGLALALAGVLAAPAGATILSGQVTGSGGQPLLGVDIDCIDLATGASIPLVGDRTDALGLYAVTVPPGDYDVQFEPPVGMRFVAAEVPGVRIAGTSQVLDQVLRAGWLLSATIVDPALVPQLSVRLTATELPSGAPVYSPYGGSDAAGFIQIVVPTGSFDLLFDPPGNGPLLPEARPGVSVNADLNLGTIVLRRGWSLSGRVVGVDGPALAGVRVSAVDPASGAVVVNGSTLTDALGAYQLWPDTGALRLDAVPGAGSSYLARRVHGLDLGGDLVLPDIVLDRGVLASGLVVDAFAAPVQDVDLDFDNSFTGRTVTTLRDNTDAAGSYSVAVRPGRYDIAFDPLAGSGLASARLLAQDLAADTVLPTVILGEGFHITGTVLAPGGAPAALVDLDVFSEATGEKLSTPGDDTDARGDFDIVVPRGTYRVAFGPPDLSGWAAAERTGVAIAAVDVDLGIIQLAASSAAAVTGMDPITGPELGGTLVTVAGSGFALGARATLGGMPLRGVVVTPTSLQGTTNVHHAGIVDLVVTNPGAAGASLVDAFEYLPSAPDPLIFLRREGPLRTDIRLDWAAVGQVTHRIFRSTDVLVFGQDQLLDAVAGTTYRDEGGLLVPGLTFYIVR